jgi:hypothetical protein
MSKINSVVGASILMVNLNVRVVGVINIIMKNVLSIEGRSGNKGPLCVISVFANLSIILKKAQEEFPSHILIINYLTALI